MSFTENQRRAITQGGNIIVSAGAGSGKTTVMIARIIDKLKKDKSVSLDQMLIVTFTRASAADMRVKLTEKLYELKADRNYCGIAEAALEALPTSNIGTLHSYCQRLIRQYFYAADLDPSAVVCEESEAGVIKQRAVSDAVDAFWAKGDPHFIAMYDMLCTRRSDDGVKRVVGDILEFALSMPDPEAYLSGSRPDGEYFAELDKIIIDKRNRIATEIAALKLDLAAAGMAKHVDGADSMLDYINGLSDDIISTSHRARHDMTDELNEQYKALKAECKKFRELKAEADASKNVDSAPYANALLLVAADAYRRYAERKKSLGKTDYSDLEHGAYRVLCDEACLSEIAQNIKYVFIDEFQDVNPLQSAIAERFRVAGAEMFVVGDVKQSIYGFRRCSPEHFKRAMNNPAYTHIPLTDNFRSSEAVVGFVNSVFDGVMTEDFGGVDYSDNSQRLVWGNKDITGGKAAFYAVDEQGKPAQDIAQGVAETQGGYSVVNGATLANGIDCEAELVADCVVDYINHSSAPKAGSIAVLVRSIKSPFCAALTAAFDRRGIRYSVGKNSSAKSYPEIVALTDILRCVDNRLDDVALYTAMRSGMGGFSDAELSEIATEGEKACRAAGAYPIGTGQRKNYVFWQKVAAYRGRLKAKVDKFIAARDRAADYALNHDCADVMGYVTSSIDYFQHVYETNGSAAAVDSLIRFAADRGCDTHAFLEYYDSGDFDLAADGGGDAVTVSTVHASKGLEYDLVILADTAKRFNESDRYARVLTSENGVFVKLPDDENRTLIKSAPWLAESLMYPDRQRAEELRLLYVALTRAKRTLITCGKKKAFKPPASPQDSACMMNFLRNVAPRAVDIESLPLGDDDDEEYPYDQKVADAVADRHRQVEEYNAKRIKSALPVKTCVTAAVHSEREQSDYTATSPVLTVDDRAGNASNADSMLRGTAYHAAMERVDFKAPDIVALRSACENFDLVDEREIITAANAMRELTVDSAFVARERYFIVNLPANQVYGDGREGNVLVQGVIDLLIVDKDGCATIVDYKTGSPSSLVNDSYRKQLELYAAAVERTTPYKVKRRALYSFAAGKLIEM